MSYFWSIFVILGIMILSKSEDLQPANKENEETLSNTVNSIEENETVLDFPDAVIDVSVVNSGLSSKTLSELHEFAKNISHSKGIYRSSEKEVMSDDEREIRRSVIKKASVGLESEVMKALLNTFDTDTDKLQQLDHMEFLVHQFDVAVSFASLGGIKILTPYLFSTDDEIAASVASVLGSSMQSNPTVQKIAMEQDIGKNLLKLLDHKSPIVLSRVIFAISSFLRNAPEAQEEFVAIHGVSKLGDILKNHQIATNTKLKIINLFHDLALEQETAELYLNEGNVEDINPLKRSFTKEIQENDICKVVPLFLNLEDFDTHQKIATAMLSLYNTCHSDFKNEGTTTRIKMLLKIYDPESDEDPRYPTPDKDLRRALYNELLNLLKKANENWNSKSSQTMLKAEL